MSRIEVRPTDLKEGNIKYDVVGPRNEVEQLVRDWEKLGVPTTAVVQIPNPQHGLNARRPHGNVEVVQIVIDTAISIGSGFAVEGVIAAVKKYRNTRATRRTDPEEAEGDSDAGAR